MRLLGHALCLLPVSLVIGCTVPPGDAGPVDDDFTCVDGLCTVDQPILKDVTFKAANKYLIKGGVFVGDDTDPTAAPTTLTIEAGTTVFGDTSALSFLLITRGSRIEAVGTAEAPIVFTSASNEGERAAGDWGGLVINGQAPVNGCAGTPCTLQGEAGTGTYGGDRADDDSGTLKFVRVEFGGRAIDDDNELNGVALQGVGSGTEIDFVQVHKGNDDCIEFFGGTANAKHLVCTGMGDDNLDWTFGWNGNVQFLVAQMHTGSGERGIEADNNESNNRLTPVSSPTISNLTLIGADVGKEGIKLRRGTEASIHNAVVTGFGTACIDLDDEATFDALAAGDIVIENSVLACDVVAKVTADDPATDEDEADPIDTNAGFTAAATGNSTGGAAVLSTSATNQTTPDFLPVAGSVALTGAVQPAGTFFEAAAFKGAFGSDDWTTGWTAYPAN